MAINNYQAVTDRIITMLESGARPWHRPWKDGAPLPDGGGFTRPLRATGKAYTGINTINLWCAAQARGFTSPYWFTYRGAAEFGGNVRKGARAELAFFVGRTTKEIVRDSGDTEERTISFLRAYNVFNANECENMPPRFYPAESPAPVAPVCERIAGADAFVAATGASVRHGGNRAFYSPSADFVQMPAPEQFGEMQRYYGVLLHELIHWTGGKPERAPRVFGARFGDETYAAEELVAELGAAFLCADLAIDAEPRADHAAYIASWITTLKNDNRAIFKAASLAEKAAGYLHKLQPGAAEEGAELAEAA